MARKFGDLGIVDKNFAYTIFSNMAGYRNRIVHFYAEISPEEICKIMRDNVSDFDIILKAVKNLLENPEKFGITSGKITQN
jgi:uncharacterized protein YutE (UPF0331/DUF86 family)